MGGGGGSPPAPKTFTPPPLQEAPVSAPIPNFFTSARPQSPYAAFQQLPQAQRPPFLNGQPLPMPGQPQDVGANIIEILKLLQKGRG